VAVVDTEFKIISYSKQWETEFLFGQKKNIQGLSFFETNELFPEELLEVFKTVFKTNTPQVNEGQFYISESLGSLWLKWMVNPWNLSNGKIGGLVIIMRDITVEKIEQELLTRGQEVAKIGSWRLDLLKNELYWSEMTKKIHEVPEDFVPKIEEATLFFKEGKSRQTIERAVNEAIKNGTSYDEILQFVTATNKEIWVRAKGARISKFNKPIELFGTFQDIDEQVRGEMARNEIANRMNLATKAAGVGIWEYDILKDNLIWDKTMFSLYGIAECDFTYDFSAWQNCLHPEDKELATQDIMNAIEKDIMFDSEFRVVFPNGDIRYIRGKAKIEKDEDGVPYKAVGTNWDTTELNEAKIELKLSQASFMGAFENSTVGMALVSIDGKLIEVNDRFCEIFGFSHKELALIKIDDLSHPDEIGKNNHLVKGLLEGKKKAVNFEKKFISKNSSLIYCLVNLTAIHGANGQLSHFISQIIDVTNMREAQNKLTDLTKMTQGQNENLMNFAHIVSHNLRSHSSNLGMLADFMAKENRDSERLKLVEMLKHATNSLEETVVHLNDVVQIKTSAQNNMSKANLLNTIKGVKNNVSALIEKSNATCNLSVDPNCVVKVVPAYLQSILLNLFTNAIKYRSAERPLVMELNSEKKNGKTTLFFRDNGLGIDLDRHGNKIFGMYKTFHKNKEAKGIGLFITKNQVEAMNGRINVESKVGEGTTFIVEFESA
jgi:PAS domain S-box-containing protein